MRLLKFYKYIDNFNREDGYPLADAWKLILHSKIYRTTKEPNATITGLINASASQTLPYSRIIDKVCSEGQEYLKKLKQNCSSIGNI